MIFVEDDINSNYLTTLFKSKGIIDKENCVVSMTKELQNSEGSLSFASDITYSENKNTLPKSIFIKLDKIRGSKHYKNLTRNEIDFYRLSQKYKIDFIPKMIDAGYDNQFSYLILEDLSETHFVCEYESSIDFYKIAAKKIAESHNKFKQLKLCDFTIGKHSPISHKAIDLDLILYNYIQILSLLGENLTKENKDILDSAWHKLKNNLGLINNHLSSKQDTIVHGDFHLKNCLFNKKIPNENMIILDWQWWNWGIGTYDMAHLLNLYLPKGYKDREIEVLKVYYDKLKELEYQYSWNECFEDYKLFTTLNLFKPAFYAINCRLRRTSKFWAAFIENIIISYNGLNI